MRGNGQSVPSLAEVKKVAWDQSETPMKPSSPSHSPHFEPTEADIQKCAYYLWQEEGCPVGKDLDIWLSAKELVRHHVALAKPPRLARKAAPAARHRPLAS